MRQPVMIAAFRSCCPLKQQPFLCLELDSTQHVYPACLALRVPTSQAIHVIASQDVLSLIARPLVQVQVHLPASQAVDGHQSLTCILLIHVLRCKRKQAGLPIDAWHSDVHLREHSHPFRADLMV